jgi:putative ATP-dependent endonuclease of the OLD family
MRIVKVTIKNFRGIKDGEILFPNHGVLVGDNNTGKSTILEAIDLALGPERMKHRPVIDEHDFYAGEYLAVETNIEIISEVIVSDLSEEQETYFKDNLEWWNKNTNTILTEPPIEETDAANVSSALRVKFIGSYDVEEDDFIGDTFYCSPVREDGTLAKFSTKDKRQCGFLILRTLRTGSRALSLERGSLLDIILDLREIKLKMWEEVLVQLRGLPIAANPELGISTILTGIQEALRNFVPSEWGTDPQLKVTDLTRENLRKNLNAFIATGATKANGEKHIAPFKKQGTGTVNTLVLSMLSMIAELKKNVIFAMEEPEIAIPPHTQKRIISTIRKQSAQALFTSHSPYVLEEFDPSEVIVLQNTNGVIRSVPASFPDSIKRKQFKEQFRKKYCEALLSKRVLIAEGRTEYDSIPVAARRLNELDPSKYSSLEALGISLIDAESDSQIEPIGKLLKSLGKTVYAIYDRQEEAQKVKIEAAIDKGFESPFKTFEKLVLDGVPAIRLKTFAVSLVTDGDWPSHITHTPSDTSTDSEIKTALENYFKWAKGAAGAANLLEGCTLNEFPDFIKTTIEAIKTYAEPPKLTAKEPNLLDELLV